MKNNLLVLEQIAMELLKGNHRFFERGFYSFFVKSEKEIDNSNNITIKFFGSIFADESEYGYSNKFHNDYYYYPDFCFAEIKCHVFYGSKIIMDKFDFEFPQSKYSDWNEEKFIRYINAVTGLDFETLEEMKRLVWCLAYLSERKEKSNGDSGEKEFNNFMGLQTTGEKHIDNKIEKLKEYFPKLDLKEGRVNINNLTDEEKSILKNTLIAYLEILDRCNRNSDNGFKFLQYIKNLLVIDKKLNS